MTRAHSTGVCKVVAGLVQNKSAVRAHGAWLASGAYHMKLLATCTLSVSSAWLCETPGSESARSISGLVPFDVLRRPLGCWSRARSVVDREHLVGDQSCVLGQGRDYLRVV